MTNNALHHAHKHLTIPSDAKITRLIKVVDFLVMVTGIIGPLIALPQAYKIWAYQDAGGVSAFSWAGYAALSALAALYGILHKQKPIYIPELCWIVVDIVIVAGALKY